MNATECNALFDQLRADDCLVIDYPTRMMGIVANICGQIVVATQDGDESAVFMLDPDEVTAICSALLREAHQAAATWRSIEAEYEAHEAIQRASGGGK